MSDAMTIVAAARCLVGRPFVHRGRGADGLDCAGVITEILRAIGAPVVDCAYAPQPDGKLFLRHLERNLDRDEPCIRVGCVVAFGLPQHAGVIVAADPYVMVHAEKGAGVVAQELSRAWVKRLHSVWRFRGVDYGGVG